MTAAMRDLGAELRAPVLVLLEGGYSVAALARSVVATVEALGGGSPAREAPAGFAAPYRERLAAYWPSLAG
jgi:acetoin utilization deacetylase AcuC-like enzyme